MNRPLFARLGSVVCLVWLYLALSALQTSAADARRVLILDPFGHDVAPFSNAISQFRVTLGRELGGAVSIYDVPLELARFGGDEAEEALVVPIGGGSVGFVTRHHERLFANQPVLVIAADPRVVSPDVL